MLYIIGTINQKIQKININFSHFLNSLMIGKLTLRKSLNNKHLETLNYLNKPVLIIVLLPAHIFRRNAASSNCTLQRACALRSHSFAVSNSYSVAGRWTLLMRVDGWSWTAVLKFAARVAIVLHMACVGCCVVLWIMLHRTRGFFLSSGRGCLGFLD